MQDDCRRSRYVGSFFRFCDGSRRDHEDSLLSQRCGIRQPVGSNHHHYFLKRSKIDISQNVKFPSKRGEPEGTCDETGARWLLKRVSKASSTMALFLFSKVCSI